MKFNEKLINLRKKSGLSQEELGYKLNVTRQTISKWELGQTTPEMDKLIEISKVFGVSLDELTNELESTDSKSQGNNNVNIEQNEKNGSNSLIIIIIIIIIAILALIGYGIWGFIRTALIGTMNQRQDIINMAQSQINMAQDQINNISDNIQQSQLDFQIKNAENQTSELNQKIDNMMENIKSEENTIQTSDIEKAAFNGPFEIYTGTHPKLFVNAILDIAIRTNKTNQNRTVEVIYKDIHITDANEITELKKSFKDNKTYEISVDYDNERICK